MSARTHSLNLARLAKIIISVLRLLYLVTICSRIPYASGLATCPPTNYDLPYAHSMYIHTFPILADRATPDRNKSL